MRLDEVMKTGSVTVVWERDSRASTLWRSKGDPE